MRLTRLVRNKHYLKLFLLPLLLTVVASAGASDQTNLVLDLTHPPPAEQEVTGFPGSSVEGSSAKPPERGYPVHLAVQLKSISPQTVTIGKTVQVEVMLHCTGESSILLPASQNAAAVLREGNRGRRTMLFILVLQDVQHGRRLSFVVGSSAGAETVRGSLLDLKPGQAVRVLLAGGLNSTDQQQTLSRWIESGVKHVNARAEVSEWTYEDKRYFIEKRSEPVLSPNSITLNLIAPN